MPKIGDLKRHHTKHESHIYIWAACIDCGKGRWVRAKNGQPAWPRCLRCSNGRLGVGCRQAGEKNHAWNGGQKIDRKGYILIRKPDHPYARSNGYISRARLVLEEKLGRYLLPGEVSHHINGDKTDDRPENLMPMLVGEHNKLHYPEKLHSMIAGKKRPRIEVQV